MQYEIRQWVIKPVLKAVIGRFNNEKEVTEYIANLKEINGFTIEKIQNIIEFQEIETGEYYEIK